MGNEPPGVAQVLLVSVTIPTYDKGQHYICSQISVKQTYPFIAVRVGDSDLSDKTKGISLGLTLSDRLKRQITRCAALAPSNT